MSQSLVRENSNSFNNTNPFNDTNSNNTSSIHNSFNIAPFNTAPPNNTYYVDHSGSGGERTEILSWLSPLEPRIQHHDISTRRVEKVGDWFFQTEEYESWFDGVRGGEPDNSALFCYGDPGVGKTYMR